MIGPRVQKTFTYAVLGIWLCAVTLPFVWVFVNSIRSSQEVFENPFGVPWIMTGSPYADVADQPTPIESAVKNFKTAWVESHFAQFFFNSVLVTSASLIGVIACGAMAAYVLARFPGRTHNALYYYFIAGMMIPAQLVLVPLFFQFSTMSEMGSRLLRPVGLELQLHDTLTGLIFVYIAFSLPFTILVLTGFFRTLPGALREAAIIDGASEWGVFRHVMLPLARPGLVTVAIFNFLGLWNEYIFALVFVNSEAKKTLPLGLAGVSIQAQYKTDFGLMFAGLVIVMIPTLIVYLILQRQLTRGITMGALKG